MNGTSMSNGDSSSPPPLSVSPEAAESMMEYVLSQVKEQGLLPGRNDRKTKVWTTKKKISLF